MIMHRAVLCLVALSLSPAALAEKPKEPVNHVTVQSLRLESDRSDEASCTKTFVATKRTDQVACFVQSKVEANGFVQKSGKVMCSERAMQEPISVCTSHYKIKEQFFAKSVGKPICVTWIFEHFDQIKGAVAISMREFDCAQMPTKETWNRKLAEKWVRN